MLAYKRSHSPGFPQVSRTCGLRLLASVAVVGAMTAAAPLRAETISQALVKAYGANPDLNSQRANVRAVDENVGRASAGWRPRLNGSVDAGFEYSDIRATSPATGTGGSVNGLTLGNSNPSALASATAAGNGSVRSVAGVARFTGNPRGVGFTAQQTLFDGNKTYNSVRQAESQVFGARESMRVTEQNILLSAASAYMNVLRDTAILNLRRSNILVLEEQLRQTRDRFQVGEVTRTDVAQADASLAQSRSDFFAAQSILQASIANYRQVVGSEPKRLDPAQTVEKLLPRRLSDAVEVSQVEHPAIATALHQVDVAALAVKVAEAALLPTATLNGTVNQRADFNGIPGYRALTAAVVGQVSIPLYQGGGEYASIRQAKEQVSQARLNADLARDQVRASLVTAWGSLEASKAQIASGQAAVAAAEIALNGIREEAKVGQRTTFDVLNAQQVLLNTRVVLVTAQRDRVVGSYSVLASMGRLSVDTLGLSVAVYDPTIHFDQVKGKLFGTTTPDGR